MPPSPVSPFEALSALAHLGWTNASADALAAEAARAAADLCGADAALVVEPAPDGRLVAIRGSHGWPAPPAPDSLPLSGWHGLEAFGDNGEATVANLPQVTGPPGPWTTAGLRSAAAVAVGAAGHAAGILAVYAHRPGAFDGTTITALRGIAALLGLALHQQVLDSELSRERDERFRLAALVEGSDDAIVSAALDGTILTWNPGAERLYGHAAHDIIGRDVSELLPADSDATRHDLVDRLRAGQRIPAFDAIHRRKDGTPVTVSLSLSPVRDTRGEVVAFAGIAHDITETRRLESQLRQAARMEAVGRLAGGLAHDFNNMLTVIDGYSELLLLKLPDDSPIRELVEEIHRAGERAADLTRQLMVFSRKSMVEPQVLDVSAVVRADVEMLARIIGEDIAIETSLAANLEHVMSDRTQFEQVLVNLVLNARDAMPTGGRLAITTENVTFDAPFRAGRHEVPPGQYVLLMVQDTGVGMDEATLQHIFDPFFTTKGSGHGTGLGLTMLQSFLMQSGSHVIVDSEPGRGTTFRLYLPTVALPVAARPRTASEAAPAGTETILVVEDDNAVRVYTESVLKAAGYEVLTAADGSEALDQARQATHPIHLLMADVVMPVLGGNALAEQFRAIHTGARVLFTSGYTPEAVSRRGVTIPPPQFLQKPYSPAALCRKIRSILDAA